jgi:hypothetical protein
MSMESDLLDAYQPRRRRPEDQVNNVALAQMRAQGLKSFEIPGRPGWFWVHGYEIEVRDGIVVFCSCPSFRFRDGICKHSERVRQRRDLI